MSSSATNVNRWAPNLVIVVQLAIWSMVGIMLVQKGAISLRENIEDREELEKIQETSKNGSRDASLPPPAGDPLKVDPPSTRRAENRHRVLRHRTIIPSTGEDQHAPDNVYRDGNQFTVDTRTESTGERAPENRNEVLLFVNHHASSTFTPDCFLEDVDEDVAVQAASNGKSPLTPVNRAGAAAAIAMLAIGVVMLLLGPIIVILRALDARRRDRRSSKLTSRRDLPPSYEQATLMDQAPRYSTLHLNNISAEEQSLCVSSSVPFREIALFGSSSSASTSAEPPTTPC